MSTGTVIAGCLLNSLGKGAFVGIMVTLSYILVTDVNPHVRDLLKRELHREGYQVYLARNSAEAQRILFGAVPLDLVILDPELPSVSGRSLLNLVQDRIPPLRIIVHTYPEFAGTLETGSNLFFVEKDAASIGPIKEMIRGLSEKWS